MRRVPRYFGLALVLGSFALVGERGVAIGSVMFRLNQVLPFLFLPVALNEWAKRRFVVRWTPPERLFLVLCLLHIGISTVFGKMADWGDLRQVKNIILPTLGMYILASALVDDLRAVRQVLVVAGWATSLSLVRVWIILWPDVFGVRLTKTLMFGELVGYLYIWLAVAALTALVGVVAWKTGSWRAILFRIGQGVLALWALIYSGTRSVLVTVVAAPLLLRVTRSISPRVWRMGSAILFLTILTFSLVPEWIPLSYYHRFGTGGTPEDVQRVLNGEAYEAGLSLRVTDWHHILRDRSPRALLLGPGYERSMQGTLVLHHPHNILIWAYLLGGVPAAAFLAMALTSLLSTTTRLVHQHGSRETMGLLVLTIAVFLVLLTNSAVGGMPQLVGLVLGVANRLADLSARGVAASS